MSMLSLFLAYVSFAIGAVGATVAVHFVRRWWAGAFATREEGQMHRPAQMPQLHVDVQ